MMADTPDIHGQTRALTAPVMSDFGWLTTKGGQDMLADNWTDDAGNLVPRGVFQTMILMILDHAEKQNVDVIHLLQYSALRFGLEHGSDSALYQRMKSETMVGSWVAE